MFDFVKKALIRLARKVVEGVMSQLLQQLNILREQALSPIQKMVQAVTGGIWIGDGADAFVEEVSNLVIPGVGQVGEHIDFVHKGLQHACDTIDQADSQVAGKAKGLADVFGAIFSG